MARTCAVLLFVALCVVLSAAHGLHSAQYGRSPSDWKSRHIYQVCRAPGAAAGAALGVPTPFNLLRLQLLTDRFNCPGCGACADISNYCGGTFNGITDRLDYITGMGFG